MIDTILGEKNCRGVYRLNVVYGIDTYHFLSAIDDHGRFHFRDNKKL